MKKNILLCFSLISVVLFTLSSCGNAKRLTYFQNIIRDSTSQVQRATLETKISKNDILQISISTLDEATTRILNAVNSTGSVGGAINGYLVDDTGIIKIPLIGAIKAEGLTKIQLATSISETILAKKYAKEPIVTVRILNYKVTVLGEVGRPGTIPAPNERLTMAEALATAGDLTPYANRKNLLLIREIDGKRIYKRFSLVNDQMMDSEIYNLQNQDIIYVEPNNAKAAASDRSTQLLPTALSIFSILLVIYTQFIR